MTVSPKEYVASCIAEPAPPTTLDDIEIHDEYVAQGERHTHVLYSWGKPNAYLVLVIDNGAAEVLGHHVLDLRDLYGLD